MNYWLSIAQRMVAIMVLMLAIGEWKAGRTKIAMLGCFVTAAMLTQASLIQHRKR